MSKKLSGLAALAVLVVLGVSCLLAGACGRIGETAPPAVGTETAQSPQSPQSALPGAGAGLEVGFSHAVLGRNQAETRAIRNAFQPAADPRDAYADARRQMIKDIESRGIKDPRLLGAMQQVPRHLFVPASYRAEAYSDKPLPLDNRRSIYQPYVVALMTSLLDLKADSRVLEIGTGSGYHTAVLARLAREVYTIEIDGAVSRAAAKRLEGLGYQNVFFHIGDGYAGWPTRSLAPPGPRPTRFDAIVLTAAPLKPPEPLLEQLKVGGRMVVPVGTSFQDLMVITKRGDGTLEKKTIAPVRVSRMEGQAQGGRGR